MSKRRYVRFSIWAMLAFMTVAALLLSKVHYEVRRAESIETTRKKVKEWKGKLDFSPRKSILTSFASFLPRYWTDEIVGINVSLFAKPQGTSYLYPSKFIDPDEVEQLVELGALDN